MRISEFTIEELIVKSKLSITNTLSVPGILESMTGFGYNEARMNEGLALNTETEGLFHINIKEYGEQYQAYNDYEDAKNATNAVYIDTYKIAGIAFRGNKEAKTALILGSSRKDRYSGWLLKVKTFYTNLLGNEEYLAAMQKYGYTTEKLQAELDLVLDTEAKDFNYDKEKGEAQQSTVNRDKKADQLSIWYRDFVDIATIALAGNPQWLEKLGIITP